MEADPKLRERIEQHDPNALDRTSTSGGGRRNPEGLEWDHDSTDPNKLRLMTKEDHLDKTRSEPQGGWANFHKDKEQ